MSNHTKESLFCTKEQSLKLVALGAFTNTLYAWVEHRDEYGKLNLLEENYGNGVPAYTVGELALIKDVESETFDPCYVADLIIKELETKLAYATAWT